MRTAPHALESAEGCARWGTTQAHGSSLVKRTRSPCLRAAASGIFSREIGPKANQSRSCRPIEAQTNNKCANVMRTSANATIISTGISDERSGIPGIFDGYEDEIERLAARVLRSVRHALSPRLLRL